MISALRRFAALGYAVTLLSSCDVATIERAPSTIAQNRCSGDSDCGGESCVDSQCRSRSSTLQSLLFEVTPPADGSAIAGVQFLKGVTSPETPLTLDLDLVSQVVGKVTVGNFKCVPTFYNGNNQLATAGDKSIPAFITLTPSESELGLYSPSSVVKSALTKDSYFSFSVNVPPGNYDIYVEPEAQRDTDPCPVPPQLRRSQPVSGGTLGTEIKLPAPSSFEFHVAWPSADGQLDAWVVDMLDSATGKVLSNRVQLSLSDPKKGDDYVAALTYSPVAVGETSGKEGEELVRLSPPAGVTAPTILLARSALGLFAANTGTLNQFTSLPSAVTLSGQVTVQSTPQGVASRVTLVATQITGIDPGVLASFVRTVDVGDDGQFSLPVLPGTYRVSAVPTPKLDNSKGPDIDPFAVSAVTQEWTVPSSPSIQAGKIVALGNTLPINGNVMDTSGKAVATALVQAVASPASLQSNVLHQALGETSYVPRASTSSVQNDGSFVLRADMGTFDVTVRPLDSTGYGWLVFPSVSVGPPGNPAGPTLTPQVMTPPVAYSGTVTTPGSDEPKVPNALIRAYIYTSKGEYVADPSKADSVLQVAETRANTDGTFKILIPAAVNAPQ